MPGADRNHSERLLLYRERAGYRGLHAEDAQ